MRTIFIVLILYIAMVIALSPTEQQQHRHFRKLPQAPYCSMSHSVGRIVGGKLASLGQFPWIARLGYIIDNCYDANMVPVYLCAGTLITENIVVTAAHCMDGETTRRCISSRRAEKLVLGTIRLGEYDQKSAIDCDSKTCAAPPQDIRVKRVTTHERYNGKFFYNDIAIVELEKKARVTEWVNPACMPMGNLLNKDYVRVVAHVPGWGRTGNSGAQSELSSRILKVVEVQVQAINKCMAPFTMNRQGGQFCVGGVANQDSCTGDSGGPLLIVDQDMSDPKEYLMGIVSYGATKCGSRGLPAVYTDVRFYMKWILDQI